MRKLLFVVVFFALAAAGAVAVRKATARPRHGTPDHWPSVARKEP